MTRRVSLLACPLLAALALAGTAEAGVGKAWALVGEPALPIGTVGTPNLLYQYNSFGGVITIQRIDTGEWHITIPGMSGTGVAHVSAFDGPHRCKAAVLPAYVYVHCLQTIDLAVPGRFSVLYFEEDATPVRAGGYLYAPPVAFGGSSPCSVPSNTWNSSGGAAGLSCGATSSTVTFQNLFMGLGAVRMVAFGSAAGPSSAYCGVSGWSPGSAPWVVPSNPARATFTCTSHISTPPFEGPVRVESAAVSLFKDVRIGELNHRGGFVYANQKSTASYNPSNQFHTGGSAISVTRTGTGAYQVNFPGLAWYGSTTAVLQVVRTSSEKLHCSLVNWGASETGALVRVQCYQANGELPSVAADAAFNLMYLTDDPI